MAGIISVPKSIPKIKTVDKGSGMLNKMNEMNEMKEMKEMKKMKKNEMEENGMVEEVVVVVVYN